VADALARTRQALVDLLGANQGGSIVAVSHEIVIRAVIADAHRLTGKSVWWFGLEPGSITRLRVWRAAWSRRSRRFVSPVLSVRTQRQ